MRKPHVPMWIVLFLAASAAACAPEPTASAGPAAEPSAVESSWKACVQSIESKEGKPASDAPKFSPSTVSLLSNGDSVAILYYAGSATYYRCENRQAADGAWELVSLSSLLPSEITVWGVKR